WTIFSKPSRLVRFVELRETSKVWSPEPFLRIYNGRTALAWLTCHALFCRRTTVAFLAILRARVQSFPHQHSQSLFFGWHSQPTNPHEFSHHRRRGIHRHGARQSSGQYGTRRARARRFERRRFARTRPARRVCARRRARCVKIMGLVARRGLCLSSRRARLRARIHSLSR